VGLADDAPRSTVPHRRLAFLNGTAVAAKAGGAEIEWLAELDTAAKQHATTLFGEPNPPRAQHSRAWSR
jgi:hypothetical protein